MPGSAMASERTLLLFILLLMSVAGWSQSSAAAHLETGRPAPSLTVQGLDGQRLALDDLRGKIVILTFWATWCIPCRAELPLLAEYQALHRQDGLEILAISLDKPGSVAEVRRIAAELNFPVGLLGSAWAGDYGRMWRLPVSFVIDRNFILRHDGWQDDQQPWTEQRLDRLVTPLLAVP